LHIEPAGDKAVEDIGKQVDGDKDGEEVLLFRDDEGEYYREHQDPVESQQVGDGKQIFLFHRGEY
jgi:hypothetical protein